MRHIMAFIGLKMLEYLLNYRIYSERPCDNIRQKFWDILSDILLKIVGHI